MEEQPINILLVEDDEDDAFFIKDLIYEGMPNPRPKITHASSPMKALESLAYEPFDICMFDFRLGEMDGIHLLRTVRSRGITYPIIFLTGQGDQEVAVEAMKAGATDYLVKSKLTAESLTQPIRFAIQLYKQEELRRKAEEGLQQSHLDLTEAHTNLQASMQKLQTAQNQILRSEKLASIGRLAAGVCHEILNPLNIISGHAQALLMERAEDIPLEEDLTSILEEIARIEKIISGLLKFSRKEEMELKNADLNEELESVLSIMEKEMLLDNIKVVKEFDLDLPKLNIDANRVRQVFLNIINNAKYAMNSGGTLTVSTLKIFKPSDNGEGDEEGPPEGDSNNNYNFLRVRFADTGTGIHKDNIEKLFDPFFTTKPEDKGTGLGLSVCYTIIEKHGGNIEVESKEGFGATFLVDLPLITPKEHEFTIEE